MFYFDLVVELTSIALAVNFIINIFGNKGLKELIDGWVGKEMTARKALGIIIFCFGSNWLSAAGFIYLLVVITRTEFLTLQNIVPIGPIFAFLKKTGDFILIFNLALCPFFSFLLLKTIKAYRGLRHYELIARESASKQ